MTTNARSCFLCLLITLAPVSHSSTKALNLWSNSPVGSCTDLNEKSNLSVKKSDEDQDESMTIVRTEVNKGKHGEKYTWYWDNTPSRNQTRSLIKINSSGKSCVILFLPIADQHNFRVDKKGNLPLIVTSATSPLTNSDGTTELVEIAYRLNRLSGFYSKNPISCKKIIDKKATGIDCNKL